MAPNCKSNDAGNLDMPKRSHKMLSLSKNVKIFYFRNEKKLNEVAKMYRRNEYSFCEIVKKEKEISASLLRQRQREKPHSHNFHYNILF